MGKICYFTYNCLFSYSYGMTKLPSINDFVNPYMHNFNVAKFLWFFLIARVALVLMIFIEI